MKPRTVMLLLITLAGVGVAAAIAFAFFIPIPPLPITAFLLLVWTTSAVFVMELGENSIQDMSTRESLRHGIRNIAPTIAVTCGAGIAALGHVAGSENLQLFGFVFLVSAGAIQVSRALVKGLRAVQKIRGR